MMPPPLQRPPYPPCEWALAGTRDQDAAGGVFSAFNFMATLADQEEPSAPEHGMGGLAGAMDEAPGGGMSAFSFLAESPLASGVPPVGVVGEGPGVEEVETAAEAAVGSQAKSSFSFLSEGVDGAADAERPSEGGQGCGLIPPGRLSDLVVDEGLRLQGPHGALGANFFPHSVLHPTAE